MFQLHLTRLSWGWRWEPSQGRLTPLLSPATQPPPSRLARSLSSLPVRTQSLRALTSRPVCPRGHPQSSIGTPLGEGL